MLVLTRKVGQQVVFPGCQVTIDVLGVSKNRVRLGIVAPSTTQVHRSEIWQRIQSEGDTAPEENIECAAETAAGDQSSAGIDA
jgi:carbon storage regulator